MLVSYAHLMHTVAVTIHYNIIFVEEGDVMDVLASLYYIN